MKAPCAPELFKLLIVVMEEFTGEFSICNVVDFDIANLAFMEHDCLGNAYKVAMITGAQIVEGLLRVSGSAFREHAWNKIGDRYFDPTKKFIFETERFRNNLRTLGIEDLNCEYVKCCEYPVGECNKVDDNNISFRYSYNLIKEVANHQRE